MAVRAPRVSETPSRWWPFVTSEWSARDLFRVPCLLSGSRLLFAAAFPATLGRPLWSLAVLAAAGVSDVLDGWYARRFHQATATGAAVDAFADKIFVLAVVASLLVSGSLSLLEVVLLGARDLGEVALGLRLRIGGRHYVATPSSNAAGKLATISQYAAIVAVILDNDARHALIGVAAVVGAIASICYWRRDVEASRPD